MKLKCEVKVDQDNPRIRTFKILEYLGDGVWEVVKQRFLEVSNHTAMYILEYKGNVSIYNTDHYKPFWDIQEIEVPE